MNIEPTVNNVDGEMFIVDDLNLISINQLTSEQCGRYGGSCDIV